MMPQRRVRERIRRAFGPVACLTGIAAVVAALVLIGCMAASPATASAHQASGPAKPAVGSDGPFERVGVPIGIGGYGDPIFSANSRRFIASNGRGEHVRVWDVSTLKPLCDPLPDTGPAWGLTFDGKIAFTTDWQSVRFWNVDTSKPTCVTKVTDGKLNDLAISPDGSQFLTIVDGEQAMGVWRTGEERPRLIIKRDVVWAAFNPTGTRIVTHAGWDTRVFSAETGKEVCPPIISYSNILPEFAELFDPTGRWLIVYEYDGIMVVDVTIGKTCFEVPLDRPWTASSEESKYVHWAPDSSKFVVAYGENFFHPHPARIYDAATGKLERTVGTNVAECWIGPGTRYALGRSGRSFDSFDLVNLRDGRRVQTLKLHNALVSPDCSTIVEAPEDGPDVIWRMQQK
ncbi:MAG TPA: WD40 repeat domain-containing protein [Tepidisphaeraceae bacterium]